MNCPYWISSLSRYRIATYLRLSNCHSTIGVNGHLKLKDYTIALPLRKNDASQLFLLIGKGNAPKGEQFPYSPISSWCSSCSGEEVKVRLLTEDFSVFVLSISLVFPLRSVFASFRSFWSDVLQLLSSIWTFFDWTSKRCYPMEI